MTGIKTAVFATLLLCGLGASAQNVNTPKIQSISICGPTGVANGDCATGFDTAQEVLAGPNGVLINEYVGMDVTADEHVTILPPGTPGNSKSDFIFYVASSVGLGPNHFPGMLKLRSTTFPVNGQWTLDFDHAADYYTDYNDIGQPIFTGYGPIFTGAMDHNTCPETANSDQTFDLNYADGGSVVFDPTNPGSGPASNLLMIYEGSNRCIGTRAVGTKKGGKNFYSTIGVATSTDGGKSWPQYLANFAGGPCSWQGELPFQNPCEGPNAPLGAFGENVLAGNLPPPASPPIYGRYAALSEAVTIADAMQGSTNHLSANMGDTAPSAFVDDIGPYTPYLYVVYQALPGPPGPWDSYVVDAENADMMIARAQLNGGIAPLEFVKWAGGQISREPQSFGTTTVPPSFTSRTFCVGFPLVSCPIQETNAGLGTSGGGYQTPIFSAIPGAKANCLASNQTRTMGSISYVVDTHQYLLTFVCESDGPPDSTASTPKGAAWFYSVLDGNDLSTQKWSPPNEVTGSWTPYIVITITSPTTNKTTSCPSFPGWYPSWMSLYENAGHLSTTGYVFYLDGCQGGGDISGRRFSSRQFFITIQ